MFTGSHPDTPPPQNTISHRRRKACRAAGVTLHELRHYFASGLIAAGCDVVTAQRALGHAKATTTLNTTPTWGRPRRTAPGRPPPD
jgi:integrase